MRERPLIEAINYKTSDSSRLKHQYIAKKIARTP
jgi:hypothetical protein